MTTEIKRTTVLNVMLTEAEESILKLADSILLKVQMEITGDTTLMNPQTGEIVTGYDIARARGVMGGIEECRQWEIQWLEQVIPLWEALGCEKMEDCTKDFILNYFKPLNLHQTRAVLETMGFYLDEIRCVD